jgi:hypothetical protein
MMVTGGALALAAAGATGLTLASRDAVQGGAPTAAVATTTAATVPVLQVGPQPAASPDSPPVLSSASSSPVRLQPPQSDPNKLQERVATATPPERAGDPPAAARAFSPPSDNTGTTPEGIRRIPLAAGRPLTPAPGAPEAQPVAPVAASEPARPMAATAPLPPRRPNIAP